MADLRASVTVPFGLVSGGNGPSIKIVGDPGVSIDLDRGVPLRVYPPGCQLVPSVGGIVRESIHEVEVPGTMLSWSGSSQKLEYVPTTAPERSLVFGFDTKTGQLVGGVTFTIDMVTGTLHSNKEFQGMVKVGKYKALYEKIYYKPEFTWANVGGLGMVAVSERMGVIGAFKDGTFYTYDVPVPDRDDSDQRIEVYRVVSTTVIAADGEWEKPQTWDSGYTGNYTDGKTGPDKDAAATKERVHEVGYVSSLLGKFSYETFPQGLKQPYQGLIRNAGTQGIQPTVNMRDQGSMLNQLFPDPFVRGQADKAIQDRKKLPYIR